MTPSYRATALSPAVRVAAAGAALVIALVFLIGSLSGGAWLLILAVAAFGVAVWLEGLATVADWWLRSAWDGAGVTKVSPKIDWRGESVRVSHRPRTQAARLDIRAGKLTLWLRTPSGATDEDVIGAAEALRARLSVAVVTIERTERPGIVRLTALRTDPLAATIAADSPEWGRD